MREPLKWIGWTSGDRGSGHPEFELLLAWRDGELDPERSGRIAGHLQGCEACRREAGGIDATLTRLPELLGSSVPAPPLQEALERLLRTIRDNDAVAAHRIRLRKQSDHRLALALDAYFGSYPQALLKRASEEQPAFREEIERLARTFLGEQAASALLGRLDPELSGA